MELWFGKYHLFWGETSSRDFSAGSHERIARKRNHIKIRIKYPKNNNKPIYAKVNKVKNLKIQRAS